MKGEKYAMNVYDDINILNIKHICNGSEHLHKYILPTF
jgi:hypothetical protein